ncbi:hypothetical protein ES703_93547 [subsurface metagenome]
MLREDGSSGNSSLIESVVDSVALAASVVSAAGVYLQPPNEKIKTIKTLNAIPPAHSDNFFIFSPQI